MSKEQKATYQILEQGSEYGLFTEKTSREIIELLGITFRKDLALIKNPKKYLFTSVSLGNIELLNGGTTNLWIGFYGEVLKSSFNLCITDMIIFEGEIPDVVYQKQEKLKKWSETHDSDVYTTNDFPNYYQS
jgi:hypothetical protein